MTETCTRVVSAIPGLLQLSRYISRDLLTTVEMFRRTSDYFLDAISTLLQVDVISPGEYLFKAGSVCRSLYIIASGSAETVKLDNQTQQWTVSMRKSSEGGPDDEGE